MQNLSLFLQNFLHSSVPCLADHMDHAYWKSAGIKQGDPYPLLESHPM